MIEEGCSFLAEWHQAAKALHTSLVSGQGKVVQWAASKHVKALNPDWYLPHVDLAMDAFKRAENAFVVLAVSGEAGRPRGGTAEIRDCRWNRVCVVYFASRLSAMKKEMWEWGRV